MSAVGTAEVIQSHGWWLASRASGLVALVLVTVSVFLGLMMSGKVMSRPGFAKKLLAIHEQTALAGLVAIAVHGITLLGDPWLHPGVAGVAVPFALGFKAFFTGLGVIAAYLAALLGLSYYVRRRIGAKLWRKAHRATVSVYLLGLTHALGAGTDAGAVWFRWWVMLTTPIVGGLFVYRIMKSRLRGRDLAGSRGRRSHPVLAEGTHAWPDLERETRAPRSRGAHVAAARRSSS